MKLLRIFCLGLLALLACSCSKKTESTAADSGVKKLTVALLPKSKGNGYFISCRDGAEKAAKELGIELIFDGPTDADPARQNEIVENWITLGVDVIAAACDNYEGIASVLKKAQSRGIKVITYDADTLPEARSFFVNQATSEGIARVLLEETARLAGNEGEYAVITASLTAGNQQGWLKHMERIRAAEFPKLKQVALRPCDDLKDKAQSEATTLMSAYPNLKVITSICTPGLPGSAEAVKQAGKIGKVQLVGLGLPSENKRYIHDGVSQSVVLWKTQDLGYLTVQAAVALAKGTLKAGDKEITAGSLGKFSIEGDQILLGRPFVFNKANIDQFDF